MDELAVLLKSVAYATPREVEVNELVCARESDDLLAAVKNSPGIVIRTRCVTDQVPVRPLWIV